MHEPSRPVDDLEKGIQGHPVHASLLFTWQGRHIKHTVNLCVWPWTVQNHGQTEPSEIKSLVKKQRMDCFSQSYCSCRAAMANNRGAPVAGQSNDRLIPEAP